MEIKPLGDITTKIGSGATPKGGNSAYQNSGISLIRSQNVLDYKFSEDGLAFINKEQADKLNNVTVQKDDVLLNITGDSIARTCLVPDEILPARVNQHVSIIRCKSGYNPRYVHYFLMNMKPYLLQICGVGGTRNALTKEALLKLPITILSQQNEIAKVLSDLDAKIEINNRINSELESIAKTLYDYWFVQFDFPDSNGKPFKTSGGKMVWNDELKRAIPEGWEVKTLLDIANFVNGLACQKFRPNENEDSYRVIKIREMGTGFTENSEFVSRNIPEKVVINNGDILFSWSATLDVKIWTGGTGALNQHIFKITSKDFPKSYYYFELLNYLQHFKMQAELRKTTMGHITQDHLKQSRITIPPSNLINKLDEIIKPILEKKVKLEEENQELASLRDWLLPMLMNGQVSVGDFEEELGMVAEPVIEYKEIKTNKTRTDKSEAFLKKVMLGCHLVYRFHQEREFGHIKFMKLLYLCEQVGEMNLMTNYQKAAAGPFDKKTLASIEKYIQTSGWFKINKEPYTGSNGKVYERTFYSLTGKSTDYQKYYNNYFESEKDKIEKLIQLFKGANSKKCEIIATTYYAYKELLKKNVLINENSLIKGFFEFHPQKGKNFKEFDVKEQLPWMKNNGVYPKRQTD